MTDIPKFLGREPPVTSPLYAEPKETIDEVDLPGVEKLFDAARQLTERVDDMQHAYKRERKAKAQLDSAQAEYDCAYAALVSAQQKFGESVEVLQQESPCHVWRLDNEQD